MINKTILIKATIYRFYSSFVTFLISLVITKNWAISAGIGISDISIKILTYYGFDVAWKKLFSVKYKDSVIWLTGLSGAGKTTIAKQLVEQLKKEGRPVMILDGDEIRNIFKNNGFDKASRDEHVRNVGRTAAFLQNQGIISIVSLISPYEEVRNECRAMAGKFIEVHVSTALDVCEQRDVKGLYKKARAGEITQFTGIHDDAPYEVPKNPEVSIDTNGKTIKDCANIILKQLKK